MAHKLYKRIEVKVIRISFVYTDFYWSSKYSFLSFQVKISSLDTLEKHNVFNKS